MKAWRAAVIACVSLAGCVAAPLVGPPTGGAVTAGPEAESLAHQAGVLPLIRMLDSVGNGFRVGGSLMLTARHVVGGDGLSFFVGTSIGELEVVRAGADDREEQDWALVRTPLVDAAEICLFPFAASVRPGDEALLIGYPAPDPEGERPPVAIHGAVIETPEVFRSRVGVPWCVDLGPSPERDGMSGSPLLVRRAGSAAWSVAGIFRGMARSGRGEIVAVVTPLPGELAAWVADAAR